MNKLPPASIAILAALAAVVVFGSVIDAAGTETPPPRERLGIRSGYIETTGKLDASFGDGSFMTLHFSERVIHSLYVDFRIGAISLGDLLKPELAPVFVESLAAARNVQSEMRVLFFTIGPLGTYAIGEKTTLYGSMGLGIYSVSMLFDTGLQAGSESDQHLGVNGGFGVLWRFAATWNVEFNFTTHKFWTSRDFTDYFYRFTDGSASPILYQFGLGISMDLR